MIFAPVLEQMTTALLAFVLVEESERWSTRHHTTAVRTERASRKASAGSGRRVVVADIPPEFTSRIGSELPGCNQGDSLASRSWESSAMPGRWSARETRYGSAASGVKYPDRLWETRGKPRARPWSKVTRPPGLVHLTEEMTQEWPPITTPPVGVKSTK